MSRRWVWVLLALTGPSWSLPLPSSAGDPGPRPLGRPLAATGNLAALVIFAKFAGEAPGVEQAPAWAADLFDPARPGSFAHFYAAMSRGRLQVRGESLPRRYSSSQPAAAYLAPTAGQLGRFGAFNLEILAQADRDTDLGRFDNDGPDGVPNSGDDDGYVDVVFINLLTVPTRFLLDTATGYASLGLDTDYLSDDPAAGGGVIRVRSRFSGFGGTTQRGHVFSVAAGTMCHEFGHVLGLVDLFDQSALGSDGRLDPAEDSAGVGKWCLMGLGTLGWGVEDGPNAFCAWSLLRLGWVDVVEVGPPVRGLVIEDLQTSGKVYRVTVTPDEYFLLENRQASGSYYNRNVPASGLLVWHVDERADNDEEHHPHVDLVCADGRYRDRGYPGNEPDPAAGGDNLDFWAHDAAYAAAHNGNQGDAGDPFDGVTDTALTATTNPSLAAYGGGACRVPLALALTRIQAQGSRFLVDVARLPTPGVVATDTTWSGTIDLDRDLVIAPGATLSLAPATQVRLAAADRAAGGLDPSRCEVIVYGSLVGPDSGQPAATILAASRRQPWAGVFLLGGQPPDVPGLQLQGSLYGTVPCRLPPGVTTWSGTRFLPVDLVVPADAKLVLADGAILSFGVDLTGRGTYPTLAELIVEGSLATEGAAAGSVRLTADMAHPDSIWCGIQLQPGADLELRGATVERAGFAIAGEVSRRCQARLADCRFADNVVSGVDLAVEGQLSVERSQFGACGRQNLKVEGSGQLSLRSVTVRSSGSEGLFLGNASLVAADVAIEAAGQANAAAGAAGVRAVGGRGQALIWRGGRIAGSAGAGVDAAAWEGRVEIEAAELTGNAGDGLRRSGGPTRLDSVSFLDNGACGVRLGGTGTAQVRACSFAGNAAAGVSWTGPLAGGVNSSRFAGATGIELAAADSVRLDHNTFARLAVGLDSRDAAPRITGNQFLDNDTAVSLVGPRLPSPFSGNTLVGNAIHVVNGAASTLAAAGNYWGTVDSATIGLRVRGNVAYLPCLPRAPDLTWVRQADLLPVAPTLGPPFPNPANGSVLIPLVLPTAGPCELTVCDVLGQPVQRLLATVIAAGPHLAAWDGRDDRGAQVGSGVYVVLLRTQAGSRQCRVVHVR